MNLRPSAAKQSAGGTAAFEYLPAASLPKLWLMYPAQGLAHDDPGAAVAGGDSGAVHAPVRQRWLQGDSDVVAGMQSLATLADTLRCCPPVSRLCCAACCVLCCVRCPVAARLPCILPPIPRVLYMWQMLL